MKKTVLVILLLSILAVPITVYGQGLNINYPEFGGVDLNCLDDPSCRPEEGELTFAKFITWLYHAIITIAVIAAFGMIVFGGVEYLVSAGSPGKVSSGVEKIKNAVIGLLIILISYLVLQAIDPHLTIVPEIGL